VKRDRPFDPYVILGIAVGASEREIRSAHRAAILLHHPDVAGSAPGQTRQAQQINAARDYLLANLQQQRGSRVRAPTGPRRPEAPPPPLWPWELPPHDQRLTSVPAWFGPPPPSKVRPPDGPWGPSSISEIMFRSMAETLAKLDDAGRNQIEMAHEIHHHLHKKSWEEIVWPTVEEARVLARYAALSIRAHAAQDRVLWAGADLVRSIPGLTSIQRKLLQELVDDQVLDNTSYGWIPITHSMVLGEGMSLIGRPRTTGHSEGTLRAEERILRGIRLDRADRTYKVHDLEIGAGLRGPCATWLRPNGDR
jgi:hypothetical protein